MDAPRFEPKTSTDEQLLIAHLAGEPKAFEALVGRYQRELFHFLVRFLGDAAAADDVFQETFIQVHNSAATFERGRNFRPWLFTIAANKARDYLRSRTRRKAMQLQAGGDGDGEDELQLINIVTDDQAGPVEKVALDELRERVQAAVHRLPEHLREVVLLAYFHQFPYKNIAEMLGIPLGTVKSRLHTAVESFGQIWKSANPRPS